MPRPLHSKATAELRKWSRKGNDFEGTVFGDNHEMRPDGSFVHVKQDTFKRVIEYPDFYLLQTHGWIYQLNKDEEV